MKDIEFMADQLDALKEFMNIALGAATAHIASLLDAFATMQVPSINIYNSEELIANIQKEMDPASKYYVVKQLFTGQFGGEFMFVMQESSAKNLGNYLNNTPNPSEDDIRDSVIEVINILSSTIVGRLTEELRTEVQFFVPSAQLLDTQNIIKHEDIKQYSKIISIRTILDFKDRKVEGTIYILTKDEAIMSLKRLVDNILEELHGNDCSES